jgi:phosphatidylethanolamine/phosphatidyl-N-methylethanolamine N-methyltransferase
VELALVDADLTLLPASSFDHVVLPYTYSAAPDPHSLIWQAFAACKAGGSVWILNHFSGDGPWRLLERALEPFARSIGFRSEFSYKTDVTDQNWDVIEEYKVNLLGLSRLIHIKKPA